MKRLYLINSKSEEAASLFVKHIRESVPNTVFLNYYDILIKRLNLGNDKIQNLDSDLRYELIPKIEEFIFKYLKKEMIAKVISKIEFRDGARIIIFFYCNNSTINYHVRRAFCKNTLVHSILLLSDLTDKIKIKPEYSYKHVIEVPGIKYVAVRNKTITPFIFRYIPTKHFMDKKLVI